MRRAHAAKTGKGETETTSAFSRMDMLMGQAPLASGEPAQGGEAPYLKARQGIARIVEAASGNKPSQVDALQTAVHELVESLATGEDLLLQALEGGETHLDLPTHMANVAVFAIRIGQGIGYGPEDLDRVGLAACLHDVGMVTVPRAILEKSEPLTAEELARIRLHPEKSHQMLQALGPEFEWVATVSLQEHEREDGSGYPHGLKGDQVHEYAKVIGLADVYEAVTHSRPYRTTLVPSALEEIARSLAQAFPEPLHQAMLRVLGPIWRGIPIRLPIKEEHKPIGTTETAAIAVPSMPSAETAPKTPPPAAEPGRREEVLYQKAQQEVARAVEAAAHGKLTALDALQAVAQDLVEFLATGDALLTRALVGGETHLDLATHMVNVAILAIRIGQGIGYDPEDLRRLGLAACLHDVGMVTVPNDLLEKRGTLSPDELVLLHQHPEKGFRMLQALGPESGWLATVALQEQEREDGSGYPHGLKGDQIHGYAKIIGLADACEAMTHKRPYQKLRVPFEAVKEIMSADRHKFPNQILKGLIHGLSTFPAGSIVRLNSKEFARVVATNRALPLRPVVEVLTGPRGDRLATPRRVDLAQNSLMYITDAASADEVSVFRAP